MLVRGEVSSVGAALSLVAEPSRADERLQRSSSELATKRWRSADFLPFYTKTRGRPKLFVLTSRDQTVVGAKPARTIWSRSSFRLASSEKCRHRPHRRIFKEIGDLEVAGVRGLDLLVDLRER